ncbi:CD4-1 molecule isoform X2 [Brachyhypopomus gauderio]|uniref:CD4-1 molecule isoform X2 n=1 Tax=Brachyhypopomus gauderio TaxID=698409 RepID=UPI0040424B5A
MLLSSALLLLLVLPYSPAAEQEKVIFAQPGNSVTIPRIQVWESETDKLYVNWYVSTVTEPLVWKTPGASHKTGTEPHWKDRVSVSKDLSLVISPVLEHDFKIFRCEQHNFIDKKETIYKLYPVIMPNTLTLIAGDSLSLSCEVKPSTFRPTVNWIVPQGISCDSQENENKYTVKANHVSDKHSGLWICSVRHDGHTLNATTVVTIIDLSTSPPDPIYTSITSSPPSIPCSLSSDISWSVLNGSGLQGGSWKFTPFNSSDPPHTLLILNLTPPSWKVLNEDRFLEHKTLNNRDLSVKSSQSSVKNRGTYTCSLHFNGDKKLSRTVQLEVLEVLSSNSSTTEGNTVNLTCTLGSPLPSDLEVKWIAPQNAHRIFPEGHQNPLSIPAVRVQDSGDWKCELRKNQTLLTSAVIALKIEKGPMDAWLIVALSSAAFIFILLPLITFIISQLIPTYQCMKRRQRKTRFCCCKNPQGKGFYKT